MSGRHPHRQRPPAQPEGHHGRPAPPRADRDHRPLGLGQELASRSTPSTPRGSGATSSRSPPTPSSSSSGCRSRWWTGSRGWPPRWRSSSGTRPSPAAPPWAPRPRSTTTCGCSGPGSARRYCRDVRRAGAARHAAVGRPMRSLAAGHRAGCRSRFPLPAIGPAQPRARSSRTCARWASCGSWPTATLLHLDELPPRRRPRPTRDGTAGGGGPARDRPSGPARDRLARGASAPRSARARASRWCCTTAAGCASPSIPPAARATRRPRRSPRRSSPSTTRAAPAPAATASARCWSTTSR